MRRDQGGYAFGTLLLIGGLGLIYLMVSPKGQALWKLLLTKYSNGSADTSGTNDITGLPWGLGQYNGVDGGGRSTTPVVPSKPQPSYPGIPTPKRSVEQ